MKISKQEYEEYVRLRCVVGILKTMLKEKEYIAQSDVAWILGVVPNDKGLAETEAGE